MKFKDIVDTTDFNFDILFKHYHLDVPEEDRYKTIEAYQSAYDELKTKEQLKSDMIMRIFYITKTVEEEIAERKTFMDMMKDGKSFLGVTVDDTYYDDNKIEDWKDFPYYTVDGYSPNDDMDYGLSLTPWGEWLGMEIDKEAIDTLTKEEILVHAMWEMTFNGYEEDEVLAYGNRLSEMVFDIKEEFDKQEGDSED